MRGVLPLCLSVIALAGGGGVAYAQTPAPIEEELVIQRILIILQADKDRWRDEIPLCKAD